MILNIWWIFLPTISAICRVKTFLNEQWTGWSQSSYNFALKTYDQYQINSKEKSYRFSCAIVLFKLVILQANIKVKERNVDLRLNKSTAESKKNTWQKGKSHIPSLFCNNNSRFSPLFFPTLIFIVFFHLFFFNLHKI